MSLINIRRVIALPATPDVNTLYFVRGSEANLMELVMVGDNASEIRHIVNKAEIAAMIAAAGGGGGGGGAATQLQTARTISATGDATWSVSFDGSGDVTAALTLANTGIAEGTYTKVTFDAKGRAISANVLTSSDIPNLDASKITSGILNRDTTGNAATADALKTARNINGVAFDGSADITISAVDATARIAESEKGAANGVATLDATGKVPASQLPSFVDDVIEQADLAAFPVTGESGKLYVAVDTGSIYRWSGTQYIEISASAGNADTATRLASIRSLSATGDLTWSVAFDGSANASGVATLVDSGVVAGTYPKVSVDSKGRVTAGATLTAADIPALDHTTVSSAGSVFLAQSDW